MATKEERQREINDCYLRRTFTLYVFFRDKKVKALIAFSNGQKSNEKKTVRPTAGTYIIQVCPP